MYRHFCVNLFGCIGVDPVRWSDRDDARSKRPWVSLLLLLGTSALIFGLVSIDGTSVTLYMPSQNQRRSAAFI